MAKAPNLIRKKPTSPAAAQRLTAVGAIVFGVANRVHILLKLTSRCCWWCRRRRWVGLGEWEDVEQLANIVPVFSLRLTLIEILTPVFLFALLQEDGESNEEEAEPEADAEAESEEATSEKDAESEEATTEKDEL